MSETKPLTIDEDALASLPVFPLPGSVLFPTTHIALHVFEPRYRRLIEDIIDDHRVLAIATLDPEGKPDQFERPPIFAIAGLGIIRRSIRLPDGRVNVIIDGVERVDISDELDPSTSITYRRVRAKVRPTKYEHHAEEVDAAITALRALCTRIITQMREGSNEMMAKLNELHDAEALVNAVAAGAVPDPVERVKLLAADDLLDRIQSVSGTLGALMLEAQAQQFVPGTGGWGVGTGEA